MLIVLFGCRICKICFYFSFLFFCVCNTSNQFFVVFFVSKNFNNLQFVFFLDFFKSITCKNYDFVQPNQRETFHIFSNRVYVSFDSSPWIRVPTIDLEKIQLNVWVFLFVVFVLFMIITLKNCLYTFDWQLQEQQ